VPAEELITVVALTDDALDEGAVATARHDLQRLPGVGAVVLLQDSSPVAVITWTHLQAKAAGPGLAPLLAVLASRFYAVVDGDLQPWAPASQAPRSLAPLRAVARRGRNAVTVPPRRRVASARRRLWRRRFLVRLRWEAWLAGTDLEVRVSKDLYVEPGTRFHLASGPALLEIGPRCRLLSGALLRLRGELLIGPGCEIRQDVSLNVKGRLRLTGRNVLGKGAMVHADAEMLWEWGAVVAEYVTVLDTHHDLDGTLVQMLDQGVTAMPIVLGAASFVGSKGTVMPGVRVGRASVVAAGSVATRDVPDGAIVGGIPAKVIRQR
jgi:acetyltransferase-like isoleucine patch superfamily enzyme